MMNQYHIILKWILKLLISIKVQNINTVIDFLDIKKEQDDEYFQKVDKCTDGFNSVSIIFNNEIIG